MTISSITGARQRRALRTVTWLLAVAAGLGLVVPDPAGMWLTAAAVLVLIAAPLLRVVWIVARLLAEGDRRYASVGALLLAVVAAGIVVSLLTRG